MNIVVGICLIIAFIGLGIVCFDQYKKEIEEDHAPNLPEPDLDRIETYLDVEVSQAQKTAFMLRLLQGATDSGYEDAWKNNPRSTWVPEQDGRCAGNWLREEIEKLEDEIEKTTEAVLKNNLIRERVFGLRLLDEIGGGVDLDNGKNK